MTSRERDRLLPVLLAKPSEDISVILGGQGKFRYCLDHMLPQGGQADPKCITRYCAGDPEGLMLLGQWCAHHERVRVLSHRFRKRMPSAVHSKV